MNRYLKPFGLAVAVLALLASVVAGRERPTLSPVPETAAQAIDISQLERAKSGPPAADPFAPKNFSPRPQAEPQRAAAPAKPEAPALPFRYVGKIIEDGKLSVFLAKGEEAVTAVAGQTIGEYRVDKVTESEVQFTYLPLKTKQSLPL